MSQYGLTINMHIKKYKVINGIMENTIFNGYTHPFVNGERIINLSTIGQSYPLKDCIEIERD